MFNACTVKYLLFVNQPGRHNSNINIQTVYTVSKQTSCNTNHFVTLDNFNVLKILLILKTAAIVFM